MWNGQRMASKDGKEESTPSPSAMSFDSVMVKEIPPPFPDLVVSNILFNLGKEDLLNCRLVSNSWNKQALHQLGKSGHVQNLDCSNLPGYINFYKEKMITQDDKEDFSVQSPLKFKISGQGHINWRSVAKNVNTLLQLAGPESINELLLTPTNSLEGVGVSILEKAALGLVSLKLSPNAFISSPMGPSVSFSKLKSISTKYDDPGSLGERRVLEFYSNLMEKCPVLEDLKYTSDSLKTSDGFELKIPFEHLKSLCFYEIYPIQDESISELVLAQIKSRPAIKPKIEFFEIDLDGETGTTTQLLEEFFPTLKTLTYETGDYKTLDNEQFTLPVLPYLQNLNMNSSHGLDDMHHPIHLKTSQINLNSESLPSLKSVTLPFGLYWDEDDNGCFSTVEDINLNLHVQDKCGKLPIPNLSITNVAAFVGHLFQRFPNVSQLCLAMVGFGPNHEIYMKRVLTAILEVESAKWLQELKIPNYEVDYLGEVLNGLDLQSGSIPLERFLTKNAMGDVKTAVTKLVRDMGMAEVKNLKFTERNGCHYAEYDESAHVLNAMEKITFSSRKGGFQLDFNNHSDPEFFTKKFLRLDMYNKYMPNLRTLEMSSDMLSTKGRADAWRVARQIEAKYPNWTVDLI